MSHSECTFPGVGRSSPSIPPAIGAVTAVAAPLAKSAVPTTIAAVLIFLIDLYRWTLSPAKVLLFGGSCGCRFTPSCSQYASEAIRHHGALAGGWLAFKRICRCHPLGGCGHDPVPTPARREGEAPLISNG